MKQLREIIFEYAKMPLKHFGQPEQKKEVASPPLPQKKYILAPKFDTGNPFEQKPISQP
jgi:hypothetical protein